MHVQDILERKRVQAQQLSQSLNRARVPRAPPH